MSFKLIDRDHGYQKLLREVLFKKGKTQITVGVHAEEGSKQKLEHYTDEKGKKAKREGKATLLDIATIHEFGLGNAPERSFLRAWFDESVSQNEELVYRLAQQVLEGKLTREQALNQMGLRFVGGIQKRITQRIPPPLAEATKRKKGSSVPLVDTGQLKSSITYKVEEIA